MRLFTSAPASTGCATAGAQIGRSFDSQRQLRESIATFTDVAAKRREKTRSSAFDEEKKRPRRDHAG